jgi:hypothetical protein
MSYTGNSKEAIQQLAGVDVVITNLQNDLTSETNSRIDAVASLRDDLNSEVGSRQAQGTDIYNLVAASEAYFSNALNTEQIARAAEDTNLSNRITSEISNRETQDAVLNTKINNVQSSLYNEFMSELANEANTRIAADNLIKADLTALTISTDSRFVTASNRLTTLETGLTAQVNEMISNNALDVVQSNLISQYAASLSEADSVIYERIAEKSGLIAVNAFRTKFNSYLNDWFGAYTLNINNVPKTAADYQIPGEVSVNQDPNL